MRSMHAMGSAATVNSLGLDRRAPEQADSPGASEVAVIPGPRSSSAFRNHRTNLRLARSLRPPDDPKKLRVLRRAGWENYRSNQYVRIRRIVAGATTSGPRPSIQHNPRRLALRKGLCHVQADVASSSYILSDAPIVNSFVKLRGCAPLRLFEMHGLGNAIGAIEIWPIPVRHVRGRGVRFLQKFDNCIDWIGRRASIVVIQYELAEFWVPLRSSFLKFS